MRILKRVLIPPCSVESARQKILFQCEGHLLVAFFVVFVVLIVASIFSRIVRRVFCCFLLGTEQVFCRVIDSRNRVFTELALRYRLLHIDL